MRSPLPWLGALLGLYLTVPLLVFLVRLGRGRELLQSTPGLGSAISVSVQTATISTLIIAVLGLPLAYVLSRGRGRTSGVVGILLQLPLAFPPLVSGLLLLYLVGPYTTLGDLFDGQLTDNRVGIVLAQVFVSAPFAVIAARSAFTALDPGWEDVAATLGHGRLARFLRVALPAAAPGIGAGLLLSWLRAFGEFGATVLLAYQPHSIPVLTYIQFGSTGLTGTTGPVLATLLISLVVVAGAPLLARVRWPVAAPVEPVPPADLPAGRPGPLVSLDLDARQGGFRLQARYEPAGRHIAVIGPSGSGKTMTLRLLAGLLPPGRSRVGFDAAPVTAVPAERRGVGYVPQEPTLLPHLRLWQQVTFAVDADPRRAAYWLHRLGLTGLERRFPHELSGGQRRRVAIVRALAHSPRLLLLDEPSSGLDTVIRDELRRELRALQRDTELTTVLVTHDPAEAILLAREVIVLQAGQVLQAGPIGTVLAQPASAAVARLVGIRNVHESPVGPDRTLSVGRLAIPVKGSGSVSWCVRPERVELTAGREALVHDVVDYGPYREVQLEWAGTALVAHTERQVEIGQAVGVRIDPADVIVWPGVVPSRAG